MGKQPLLPGLPDAIVREISNMDTDALVARILDLEEQQLLTPGAWTHCDRSESGKNWTLASFGADQEGRQWILTTDSIPVSQMYGDARGDAEFCAIARTLLPRLIAERDNRNDLRTGEPGR